MTTVTDITPAALAPKPVSREVAMAWYAVGRTAQGRRALAALPVAVEAHAGLCGITPDEMRAELLAVADGIDLIVAEGLTRAQAWYAAGLDQFHGPYPAAAVAVPAQRGRP